MLFIFEHARKKRPGLFGRTALEANMLGVDQCFLRSTLPCISHRGVGKTPRSAQNSRTALPAPAYWEPFTSWTSSAPPGERRSQKSGRAAAVGA